MLQSFKQAPLKIAAAALKPRSTVAGWRYRLHRLLSPRAAEKTPVAPEDDAFKQLSFTFAVIALSAQVACIDGALSAEKYAAFREAFPLKGKLCGKIRSLFALACENHTPYSHYAAQVKYTFAGRTALFASLVDRLFSIAAADGAVSPQAERILSDIAYVLNVSPAAYAAIFARHDRPAAHEVLQLPKRPAPSALKQRYRQLMRSWHPDRFADELSPDIQLVLSLKASEINEAYRRLSKKAA